MKKRITLVSKGNKKALCYAALIVLSESQAKKLANDELIKLIDNAAIDLGIEWAVELSGNYEILAVSRTTFSPIEEEMLKDIEKTAHEFICVVDKLDVPSNEPECPSHEDANLTDETEEQRVKFAKDLLNLSIPDKKDSYAIMHEIIPGTVSATIGNISRTMMKEMLELYLSNHDK